MKDNMEQKTLSDLSGFGLRQLFFGFGRLSILFCQFWRLPIYHLHSIASSCR
jgi:hypothetical protein